MVLKTISPGCGLRASLMLFFLTSAHKGWAYNCPVHRPVSGFGSSGHKALGIPQPKPIHGFLPNFLDVFNPRGSGTD